MTPEPIPSISALLALALACASLSGCATWDGVADGPSASLYFDARLPEEANAKRLRVEIHDFEGRCPGNRTHFYSASFEGTVPPNDPPYTVELPASKRVWLNILYYDAKTTHAALVGFDLEPNEEYVALYRNDGKRFGFAISSARTGEVIALMSPRDCQRPFRLSNLWNGEAWREFFFGRSDSRASRGTNPE